ncbi:uncharacterized protein Bfra_000176 [Botrytis fragariae]|uniref:Uncharacterized protein n=1 Tax=Botrytis fragariae TaxID=1964551 RepID=A0A8H6EN53_9HELO|nr:uncharacterized protein Bfra_000176 [Botrytis fragariae]KAF5878010.1 hypothetical protein Bfra_000176 [Botrytis fragariae]
MLLYQLPFSSLCNKSAPASKVMIVEGCVVDKIVVEDKFSKSQSCTFELTEIKSGVKQNPVPNPERAKHVKFSRSNKKTIQGMFKTT